MKIKEYKSKLSGRHIRIWCDMKCHHTDIYAPFPRDKDDDLYEIGGVVLERKEWAKIFRRVGIL